MELPISVVVTRRGETYQRWFAHDAASRVAPPPPTRFDLSEHGLVVRGATEADLEAALVAIRAVFPDAECGHPEVEYLKGERWFEPYYRLEARVPEDAVGGVLVDLSSRRANIASVESSGATRTVAAEVPVSECFGYTMELRRLTRGRGTFTMKVIGYRPFPFRGPGSGEPTLA